MDRAASWLAGVLGKRQNTFMRLKFGNYFPDNINANLHQVSDIMSMSDIISRLYVQSFYNMI